MATARKSKVVEPLKDEDAAHPVPTAWRPTFSAIVKSFVRGDYALARSIPSVKRVSKRTASQVASYIAEYGETLVELPEKTWKTSIAQWSGAHWEVLVDLWTKESGASDLVLYAWVTEAKDGFRVEILTVHVP